MVLPTGERCVNLGAAVRQAIEASDVKGRVAIIGSGGMWHTPSMKGAYVDEKFDNALIDAMVPPGHSSTYGYTDPNYPVAGRFARTQAGK